MVQTGPYKSVLRMEAVLPFVLLLMPTLVERGGSRKSDVVRSCESWNDDSCGLEVRNTE